MNHEPSIPRSVRFERATEHGVRYYEIRVQPDLFGLVVIRVWGRRGSRMGRMVTTPCVDDKQAENIYNRCVRQRKRRKYHQTTIPH